MSTVVNKGWLKDNNGERFAPKTLLSQVVDKDGELLETYIDSAVYADVEDNVNVDYVEEDNITIDDALSETSVNPVQNKIVTEKFNELSQEIEDLENGKAEKNAIPTRTSQLTNDSNFVRKNELPTVTQNTGNSETDVMSQSAITTALKHLTSLPYGGSKDWLEANGDKTKLYQINGYVCGYVESNGWTQSGMQFLVVDNENKMTNVGGTEYILRSGNEGTVYNYTEASGDAGIPVHNTLPVTANEGDVVAVGGKKYKASLSSVTVEHNAYNPNTAQFNKRLAASDGGLRDLNGALLLDYTEVEYNPNCIVTIKGMANNLQKNYSSYFIVDFYDKDKNRLGYIPGGTFFLPHTSAAINDNGTLPLSFRLFAYNDQLDTTNVGYVRIKLGIKPDGTSISASDVEGLVVNFSTKNETKTEVKWTEIGTYTPPVEAGWNPTDEIYNIIDSLSVTANSGDVAVYSVDGFSYTYTNGSNWIQMSKYNAPTLAIDGELSDSSTNAVQNRIVAEHITELNAKVKTNTDELLAIKKGFESVSTVPTWWQNAVTDCIAKIKTLQNGRNCITFPFFSDNHCNTGYAGVLIAAVMKECGIPYCFYGGDTIGSAYIANEEEMIVQDKNFDDMMSYIPDGRFCRTVGNHDGFWKVSATEKYGYTRPQVYELFLRAESIAQNKHFGEDGTYYYVDDMASKVRFIILNTNPLENVGAGAEIIDTTQLYWLQNTALHFNEDGWAVVVFSHCPISNHYHANVRNNVEVVSVVNNSGVDVIGWFSGHVHRDRIYTHFGVNGTDNVRGDDGDSLGFTQVIITSDRTDIAYKNDDGTESSTKHPIGNDDLSHAIDFVTINRDTRTVNITRLGIGEDRSYTY